MKYKIGDKVRHPEYGEGRIIDIFNKSPHHEYFVMYDNKVLRWYFSEVIDKIIVKDFKMQKITKDNLTQLLDYNKINYGYSGTYISMGTYGESYIELSTEHHNLVAIIEAHLGKKLEPLPESNPFDIVRVGQWIRFIGSTTQSFTENKWYKITYRTYTDFNIKDNFDGHHLWTNMRYINECWDLTQILDYNPDEEIVLKIGDKVEYLNTIHFIKEFDYVTERVIFKDGHSEFFSCFYQGSNCCPSNGTVNGKRGKFVIPPFDLQQTLLDAGFKNYKYLNGHIEFYIGERGFSPLEIYSKDNEYAIGSTSWEWKLKPTPQNAKILIELKSKFEELEK